MTREDIHPSESAKGSLPSRFPIPSANVDASGRWSTSRVVSGYPSLGSVELTHEAKALGVRLKCEHLGEVFQQMTDSDHVGMFCAACGVCLGVEAI